MRTRLQTLLGIALMAALPVMANAAVFRFHDYSENPDAAWLTVDGVGVTGDGSYGGGIILGFNIDPRYENGLVLNGDYGERITFSWFHGDLCPGQTCAGPTLFTQLSEGLGVFGSFFGISDEFVIESDSRPRPHSPFGTPDNAMFSVDFISYDSPIPGVIWTHHRDPITNLSLLPGALQLSERPEWQLVGSVRTPLVGVQQTGDEFWVLSQIPEPESYALMLAGLGVLGFAARRRKLNA